MDVKKKWTSPEVTDLGYESIADTITNVQTNFDIRRYQSAAGYSVLIDDILTQVIIQYHTNPLNENREDRILLTPHDTAIHRGSQVVIANSTRTGMDGTWLALSAVESVDGAYNSIQIHKTNNNLKFIDNSGNIQNYRCVINNTLNETSPLGSRVVALPEGTIMLQVQYNSDTAKIKINQRFLFEHRTACNAYKVVGVNNLTDENLLELTLNVDVINEATDDTVDKIADAFAYGYSLNIDEANFAESIGYSAQLNYTLKLNDVTITENVIWSTSDASLGTIDASGQITLIDLGQVVFTCQLEGNDPIFDAITIDIETVPTVSDAVRFTPDTTAIYSYSGADVTYAVYKYTNNTVQVDTFVLTLSGADALNYVYTYVDGNHFNIKSNGYDSEELVVTATSVVDGATEQIAIKLKSLF